ncbi:hypothetical protein EJ02DRAFT_437187 [Clathrospora elynae]|uniref:Uncharacterized protein n=1 Tax=Clathrospora elynae TaxID=706981 RepID=A0A6A5SFD4_9PLEO|nr:hypothetical protein EJ02DRAFT_437187 [Clathrospora elynae]
MPTTWPTKMISLFTPISTISVASQPSQVLPLLLRVTTTETDQIWHSDEPRPTRIFSSHTPHPISTWNAVKRDNIRVEEGIDVDTRGGTDCHPDQENNIYFTIAYPDGNLVENSAGVALFYVRTDWILTYPKILRKALFNDPAPSRGCHKGHCVSEPIPGIQYQGSPVVLKYVKDPEPLREGWHGARCQYDDSVRKINKSGVKLGQIGYFVYGSYPPQAVLDFVEEKTRTTYPTLEITMICMFTVGLLPSLFAIVGIICILVELHRWLKITVPKLWKWILGAPAKGSTKMKTAWNRVSGRRPENGRVQTTDAPAHNLPDYPTTRPPSYKSYENGEGIF